MVVGIIGDCLVVLKNVRGSNGIQQGKEKGSRETGVVLHSCITRVSCEVGGD